MKSEQSDFFKHLFGGEKPSPKIEKRPLVLSYSQISIYQQCPLKYKFQYIERRPSKPSPHLDFGITIHNTLKDFHEDFDPNRASLADLLNLYEKSWLAEGYES